jgi:hypothetical protein
MKNITTDGRLFGNGSVKGPHSRQKLDRGRVVSVDCPGSGFSLCCLEGVLWITRAGDPADHILREVDSWTADGPGMVVIEAVEDSAFVVIEPPSLLHASELLKELS